MDIIYEKMISQPFLKFGILLVYKLEKRTMGVYHREEQAVFTSPVQPEDATKDDHETILTALSNRRTLLDTALAHFSARVSVLTEVAQCLVSTLRSGHKVLVAGNGGSAAEAQHFAAELVGRFKRERLPYAVLALTTDSATLTSVANDYGYEEVFARQVLAFGQPGDLLIAFSTSGESENLLHAAVAGHQCLMTTIAVTGDRPSRLAGQVDMTIRVPVVNTAVIQELHMVVTHILCDIVESRLASYEDEGER